MSRKNFYIIISISIIILIIIFLLPFFLKNKDGQSMTIPEAVQEFWPFGKPSSSTGFQNQNNTNNVQNNQETGASSSTVVIIPRLRHLTTTPTSGSVIIERDKVSIENKVKKIQKEYFVRYMDRGTGHIDETKIDSLDVNRISNTSLSQIYETTFSPDGNSFIGRFLAQNLDDIKTFLGVLKDKNIAVVATTSSSSKKSSTTPIVATTTTEISITASTTDNLKQFSGKYLDMNIRELAFSPSKSKTLSLTYNPSTGGSAIGISSFDGTGKKIILNSPLREWLLYYPTETKAVLATKPSAITDGFAYILDTVNGTMTKVAGNLPGLTVLPSRDLSNILVGSGGQNINMSVVRVKDKAIIATFKTIPDKCVWAKKNNIDLYCAIPELIADSSYPDSWYQGFVSFNDQIWKINTKTGIANSIATPELLVGSSIDSINLDISPDDNYLTFINKKDLTLWGLTIDTATTSISVSTSTKTTTTPLLK